MQLARRHLPRQLGIRAVLAVVGTLATIVGTGACASVSSVSPSLDDAALAAPARFDIGGFRVAAEGPCSRLSAFAIGDRRVLVFGDTGYDLAGWLPEDNVPAAQSVALLTPRGAGTDPYLLEGLPLDARGYVPGDLQIGGSDDANAWLLRVTTRYAPGGGGALFARAADGYRLGPYGWARASGSPVERPREAGGLPALPTDACGASGVFVPLASATTHGGVLVAGRCDDARVPNPAEAAILVAHGRPAARAWEIRRVPGTSNLDGIVNIEIDARSDDDAVLTAWEPFVAPQRRQSFLARWKGRGWSPAAIDVPGGYIDVAHDPSGDLLVANGRGAYRVNAAGRAVVIELPEPRFARGSAKDRYVHRVKTFGPEVWIEASYRVWPVGGRPAVWASTLFTTAQVPQTVHCDASETAERALSEVP